jgi:hypothetical protein
MVKLAPITIPTKPIGSIPRPTDLIERVAKPDGEDPRSHRSSRSHIETPEEGPTVFVPTRLALVLGRRLIFN